jgi:hypothetical protein
MERTGKPIIGHYLLTLTPEQEDRVLTMKLQGGWYRNRKSDCRCLRGAAEDYDGKTQPRGFADERRGLNSWHYGPSCGDRYDALHKRWGERLNVAIRNRILANRARRMLTQISESVAV